MSSSSDNEPGSTKKKRGPAILESIWILMSLSSLVLIARIYVRIHIIKKISLADWVMVLSYLLTITASISYTISVYWGLGTPEFVGAHQLVQLQKWNIIGTVTGILGSMFTRLSFCIMLFALTSATSDRPISRIILWTVGISQVLANVGMFVFTLSQCKPITRIWDTGVDGTCLPLRYLERFGFFQGSINSATDLALAIFPATIIWNLNMKPAIKASLIITMGLGVFTMVASIMKTIYIRSLVGTGDFSAQTSELTIWFALEIWFLIIAASIPTLRPLLSNSHMTRSGQSTAPTTIGSKSRRIFANPTRDHIELADDPPGAPFDRTYFNSDSEMGDGSGDEGAGKEEHNGTRKTMEVKVTTSSSTC